MYDLLLILQYIGIIGLFFEILYVSRQHGSRLQTILVILLYASLFNIVGYTLEMEAKTQELAMQSVKMTYIGKPFVVFTMYVFVMEYCGVSIKKSRRNFFYAICVAIAGLVYTNEYHHLFYSSVSYTNDGLFPHLVLKHGIFYNLYSVILLYYFVGMIYVCVRKYRQNDSEIIRKQVSVLMVMVLFSSGCLALFLFNLTNGYDTTALAYIVAVFLFERLMRKYKLFDTLTLAKEEAVEHMSNGLIVVNVYGDMVYSNDEADRVLLYIRKHGNKGIEYLEELANNSKYMFVDECSQEDGNKHADSEKCVYELTMHEIFRNENSYGKMLLITEITDSYYYTERLQNELKKKTREVISIQRDIIGSFASMIEARDGITGLHIKNTANLVKVLVNVMKNNPKYSGIITDEYAQMTAAAAHLHDIGKIAIPDRILQKEGKLTDEEFAIMKTHPVEGAKILENTIKGLESDAYYQIAHDMVLYHHEKYDGNGYPTGISGENIPLTARIMAVADVYDALRSKRHYKDGFSKEKSMAIMEESKGTHFDADIVTIFLEHIDEMEAVLDTGAKK
ncbi:MAG: histidine kinase N-terminal 7TM domain-containing protein [Lachnospiraceae bacterium]|nr:histidine kinase N-terminal 7TM domain-containing protein [Lachnospiraceae bacterium]